MGKINILKLYYREEREVECVIILFFFILIYDNLKIVGSNGKKIFYYM